MQIIRDGVIILSITVLMLVIAEFGMRFVFPEKIEKAFDASNLAYEYDNKTIIRLKPNIEKKFKRQNKNGGNEITWRTNSYRYRGPEIGPKNGFRIIVYGDSNIQARFSEYKNTYPYKLKENLEKIIPNIEVINAGLVGSGPDQSVLRFLDDYEILKPDVLILHVFADNDYGDIVRNRLFELDYNKELIKTNFKIKKDQELQEEKKDIITSVNSLLLVKALRKLVSSNESNLTKLQKAQKIITDLMMQSEKEYEIYKSGSPKFISHFADHYDIDVAITPNSQSTKTKILLMEKLIKLAGTEAKRRNVKLLVLVQPSVFDFSNNYAPFGPEHLSGFNNYKESNITAPLKRICSSLKVNCIHLYDYFSKNTPQMFYLKGDNHWNDLGQKTAADLTADYLMQNKYFKYANKNINLKLSF